MSEERRTVESGKLKAQPALNTQPAFEAEAVALQRRMRFNPLRMLTPERLSMAHDQFDIGIINQAAMLWDAIVRRDDTLSFVVPQLENSIAGKPWGVFKRKDADPKEAARHAAALEYFYDNVAAVDAFDRNERGDRHLLLKQMSRAYAYRYAVHHFVWRPQPGKMIELAGAKPVPALSAEMEFVPLWYFENTTGTMRFLPQGGFGVTGQAMDFEGEWMCTSGAGAMFAAAACYVFKRLTFQDWTIFNEKYSQQKPVGQTPESAESVQGKAMADIIANFNGDQGIVLYGAQPGAELPIKLLGPAGTVSVDLFERFLDRQDRKMTVLFRGSDLRNMSREKDTTGVSAQTQETEALERAHCASIASACRAFIDRAVIRYCFGEGVEPLAYFGLPDMDDDDAGQLRENAGFLADRGVLVDAATIADRLGVTTTEDEEDALTSNSARPAAGEERTPEKETEEDLRTENAAARLEGLIEKALWSENGDKPGHEFRGNQWTATASSKADSIDDVIAAAKTSSGKETWFDYAELGADELKHLKDSTGKDFTGYKHLVDSGTVRKILRDHGDDPSPVTEQDFQQLGDYLKAAEFHHLSPAKGKLDRIVYVTRDASGRLMLVEEIRTGRKKLALKTLYRP